MVPVIASSGASFKGAFAYYFHDKNAWTDARVAWTQTVNMMTDCATKAWKVMSYTAKHAACLKEASGQKRTGRKLEKPVFAYSLSWHPEEKPDKTAMLEAANQSLQALSLSDHEAMIACHNDEPHPHIHIVVNRVHPLTGIAAKVSRSKCKLSDWARKYEEAQGKIYCPRRVENHKKRQRGQQTKYGDPVIAEAWKNSADAKSFTQRLEANGYHLAQGRKQLVIVTPHDKTINPVRMIPSVKAAEFNARMNGIDPQTLPTPEEVITRQNQPQTGQWEKEEAEQTKDECILDAIYCLTEKQNIQRSHAEEISRKRIEKARENLTAYFKLEKCQNVIDKLQTKLDAPTLLPKFARKLFGMDRKTEEKLVALRANQKAAKTRFKQNLTAIQKSEIQSLQRLKSRHTREQENLSGRLERKLEQERNQSQDNLLLKHLPSTSISQHSENPRLIR